MKGIANALVNAVTYGLHLAIAWVLSYALRHGFHINPEWFDLGTLTFSFTKLATFILAELRSVWHRVDDLHAVVSK